MFQINSSKMENNQIHYLKEALKYKLDNMNKSSDILNEAKNMEPDPMIINVRSYFFARKIQQLNALWEVIVNSQNKTFAEEMTHIFMLSEYYTRVNIQDLSLLQENKQSSTILLEKMEQNVCFENIYPTAWFDIFSKSNAKAETYDNSTQTENKQSMNDSGTQTFSDQIIKEISNSSTQTNIVKIPAKSATTQTSYAETVKKMCERHNTEKPSTSTKHIETKKTIEKPSTSKIKTIQDHSPNLKINTRENSFKKVINQRTSSKKSSFTNNHSSKNYNIATNNYYEKLTSLINQKINRIIILQINTGKMRL